MTGKDVEKELSDQMGGWENLARELFKLCTDNGINCCDEILGRNDLSRAIKAFTSVKRGAKKKNNLTWFFLAEQILRDGKSKNPLDSERFHIEKNLKHLCNKNLRHSNAAQRAAIKTIQNNLSTFRKQSLVFKSRAYKPSLLTELLTNSVIPQKEALALDPLLCVNKII